jgi:hypothetical protein
MCFFVKHERLAVDLGKQCLCLVLNTAHIRIHLNIFFVICNEVWGLSHLTATHCTVDHCAAVFVQSVAAEQSSRG